MHLTLPGQHKPEWGGQYGRNFHLDTEQFFKKGYSALAKEITESELFNFK